MKFRTLVTTLVALATLTTGAVAADHINLHNGYIAIRNDGAIPLRLFFIRHIIPGFMRLATLQSEVVIPAHTTFIANRCCYAAGSNYEMEVGYTRKDVRLGVVPRLCNVHGIPHGYAELAFHPVHRQSVAFGWYYKAEGGRIDTGCP